MQGQDERLGVVEAKVEFVGVGEGVKAIDGGRYPRNQESQKEQESHARIQPSIRIRLTERRIPRQTPHPKHLRRTWFSLPFLGTLADLNIHTVGIKPITALLGFCSGYRGYCFFVEGVLLFASVGCDVDFGGDGAFERILIEGVEEAVKFVSVAPDLYAGHCVDYHCER